MTYIPAKVKYIKDNSITNLEIKVNEYLKLNPGWKVGQLVIIENFTQDRYIQVLVCNEQFE